MYINEASTIGTFDPPASKSNQIITDDIKNICLALSFIPAIDRDIWVKVGMAIHSELPGTTGFEIFDNWSHTAAEQYDSASTYSTWKSFKHGGGITIKTLFKLATENGWVADKKISKPTWHTNLNEENIGETQVSNLQKEKTHNAVGNTAKRILDSAEDADIGHWYLLEKRFQQSYGCKIDSLGDLLIPVYINHEISNLQRITNSRKKLFLKNGKVSGGYFQIGEISSTSIICIAEGFATAASIFESTGYPTFAAFSASNLAKVAKWVKQQYSTHIILICGDDDVDNPSNPGRRAAENAAREIATMAVFPFFKNRQSNQKDFNDLFIDEGTGSICEIFEKSLNTLFISGNTGNAGNKVTRDNIDRDLGVPNCEIDQESRLGTATNLGTKSAFRIIRNHKNWKDGVYYIGENSGDPEYIWICSPLEILAETRDYSNQNWGRLLKWSDNDGQIHEWACPAELLQASDQSEFRKILANKGLLISSNSRARRLLCDYVLTQVVKSKARCVEKIGWVNEQYVTGTKVFGKNDKDSEQLIYQGSVATDFSSNGSLNDWRQTVARMASGNTRIVFSLACSFAGVLTEITGESGGGFQFTDQTSKGKTSTLIDPAASVWGHPDNFAKKWRATTNGLESLCLARNHNILILDDLGQIDPKEAGQAAYMIANGQGKARMLKDTSTRPLTTWKTLLLSSGEIDLSQHIASIGQKIKGGQAVRLPSIPADAGAGWYVVENLHEHESGAEFSNKIKLFARKYYGTAGTAFLEMVTKDFHIIEEDIQSTLNEIILKFDLPPKHPPEIRRVAARFALVAYAGELATKYQITGWKQGEVFKSAKRCFQDWLSQNNDTSYDDRFLLNQVSEYLQKYSESRFPNVQIDPAELSRFPICSGFRRIYDNKVDYLIYSEIFKNELCKGFGHKSAISILRNKGWLIPGPDRSQIKVLNNLQRRLTLISIHARRFPVKPPKISIKRGVITLT